MTMAASPITRAEEGYLLLADISGFSSFMVNVGDAHGVDFEQGIPPGFALMGALLDSVAEGLTDPFQIEKFEGDAIFAAAPAAGLDGRGRDVLEGLRATYGRFIEARAAADPKRQNHDCVACALVGNLDLKMVLHVGPYVRQAVQQQTEFLGPSVNVVHRMLKSSVADVVGHRHYLHLTDAAAGRLGVPGVGIPHLESYPDVGDVPGRVLDLAGA